MLYTGFREIDDNLGGIENGELVVIVDNSMVKHFQNNILYNLAKQVDTRNRQNIKNYDKKIKAIGKYDKVKLEKPIEKVVVLGRHDLEFNVLSCFPRGEYEAEQFKLFTQRRRLFKDLPIEQSFYNIYQRSAKVFIKEISYHDNTQNMALCIFGNQRKIPLLKEVAQKLNIPVVMFIYGDMEFASHELRAQAGNIDKLVVSEDNYYKEEYINTPRKNTSTFYLENYKTKQTDTIISNYRPDLFFEIYAEYPDKHLQETNPAYILQRMANNNDYINKYNFSKYLHLSREKNKKFWAYIEAFQRIQIDDLGELIAEYKPNFDKQELMLAAVILRKLLTRCDNNAEQIMILPKNSA